MPHSQPVDGFRLAYSDSRQTSNETTAVVLLHGWPGDATDYRHVVPLLTPDHRVVVPDLRASVTAIATSAVTPTAFTARRRRPRASPPSLNELGLVRPCVSFMRPATTMASRPLSIQRTMNNVCFFLSVTSKAGRVGHVIDRGVR